MCGRIILKIVILIVIMSDWLRCLACGARRSEISVNGPSHLFAYENGEIVYTGTNSHLKVTLDQAQNEVHNNNNHNNVKNSSATSPRISYANRELIEQLKANSGVDLESDQNSNSNPNAYPNPNANRGRSYQLEQGEKCDPVVGWCDYGAWMYCHRDATGGGTCDCLHPKRQVFDPIRQRCVGMPGTECNVYIGERDCVSNSFCSFNRATGQSLCKCKSGYERQGVFCKSQMPIGFPQSASSSNNNVNGHVNPNVNPNPNFNPSSNLLTADSTSTFRRVHTPSPRFPYQQQQHY